MSVTSSFSTLSSEAKTKYRLIVLPENGVTISTRRSLRAVKASSCDTPSVVGLSGGCIAEDFVYADNGYDDAQVLEHAVVMTERLLRSYGSRSYKSWDWSLNDSFKLFSMFEVFSRSRRELWKYDVALTNYLPNRTLLSAPKPDYAFGLKFQPRSRLWEKVRTLRDVTMPTVSPICVPILTAPFLIVKTLSDDGSIRTGENQLCNAMIKGHDILNSLDLQATCFLLGIVQVEVSARLYLSVSTQARDGANRYPDEIYLILLDICNLASFAGHLKFLKFVQYAKTYGQTRFRKSFEDAVNRLMP